MKPLAPLSLSLAALSLAACAEATNIVAPSAPGVQAAVTHASSSYSQPFNSTLINACSGETLTIAGTQEFVFADRRTKSGKEFTSMEGVIDGVATSASGVESAFHQSATTTTRQASPDSPIYGKSSYTFTVAGAVDSEDFIVRIATDFVYDPLSGSFTTTRSSEKADCR